MTTERHHFKGWRLIPHFEDQWSTGSGYDAPGAQFSPRQTVCAKEAKPHQRVRLRSSFIPAKSLSFCLFQWAVKVEAKLSDASSDSYFIYIIIYTCIYIYYNMYNIYVYIYICLEIILKHCSFRPNASFLVGFFRSYDGWTPGALESLEPAATWQLIGPGSSQPFVITNHGKTIGNP